MNYASECTPGGAFAAASGLDAVLKFSKYPELELFMQRANLPEVNAALPTVSGPHYQALAQPPTKLVYSDLVCTFMVRADFSNYILLQKWMRDSLTEQKDEVCSDIMQIFMTSDGTPVLEARYIRALPHHISELQTAIDTTDPQILKCTVIFKYNKYDVGAPTYGYN